MTPNEKRRAVTAGELQFGEDFFMVDPRGGVPGRVYENSSVVAAPFHIQNEQDVAVFVNFANSSIPWVASGRAFYQPKQEGVM